MSDPATLSTILGVMGAMGGSKSSGGGNTTINTDPWIHQQPYLQGGMRQAANLYGFNPLTQYYQGEQEKAAQTYLNAAMGTSGEDRENENSQGVTAADIGNAINQNSGGQYNGTEDTTGGPNDAPGNLGGPTYGRRIASRDGGDGGGPDRDYYRGYGGGHDQDNGPDIGYTNGVQNAPYQDPTMGIQDPGSFGPQYYNGSTVSGFGDISNAAHSNINDRATGGNTLNADAQTYATNALSNSGDYSNTLGGFAQGRGTNSLANKFGQFSGDQNRALNSAIYDAKEGVMDSVNSNFGLGGRSNSGYHALMAAKGAGQVENSMRSANFNNNMNRNLSALGQGAGYQDKNLNRQFNAANLGLGYGQNAMNAAGGLANQDYFDLGMQQQLGQVQDDMGQQKLDANVAKWDYNQQLPYDNVQNYMNLINGNYGSQETTSQPSYGGGLLGGIGGGLSGYALGQSLMG